MTKALAELAATARQLANDCFGSDQLCCTSYLFHKKRSCLQVEEERPLDKSERALGWAMRPFWAYTTERMCLACAAYYYAERAAQLLHEKHCAAQIEARAKARNQRKEN
jgi:hypothetical protein